MRVLRDLPKEKEIGLGCVDCRSEHLDSPDEIVARVQKALEHVNSSRIYLNPDCGFAPGSAADIPIDEAYLKLKNEVEAAKILRKLEGGKA
jgi:5-methyltetrahydropteroyltriglutamate--homocysteine methyltransferase